MSYSRSCAGWICPSTPLVIRYPIPEGPRPVLRMSKTIERCVVLELLMLRQATVADEVDFTLR